MAWIPFPILVASVALLLQAEHHTPRDVGQVKVWKPLATLSVIGACALSLLQPGRDTGYALWILVGLGLSLAGDVLLIFQENPKAFLAGLVVFLLAHVAYLLAFARIQLMSGATPGGSGEIVVAAVLALIGMVVYRLMRPGLRKLRWPVIFYMAVISVMVHRAFAVSVLYPSRSTQPALILAGAMLFYLSDAILGINKFRFGGQLRHGKLANLLTYYAGQWLLALSASL